MSATAEPLPRAVPDAELAALLRTREPAAFAALMRRHNQRLYRLARGIVRDDAEAEEVVQEGYVRAFTHIEEFEGRSSLATWLARIVLNEALGRLRSRRPTVEIGEVADTLGACRDPALAGGDEASPEQMLARMQLRRAIERAVDRLPPPFRAVFMLRAIEQMSIAETAHSLGIPEDTVKSRFHRANKLLRGALSAEFGSLLDGVFPFLGARCDRLTRGVLERLGLAAATPSTALPGDRPAAPGFRQSHRSPFDQE